MTQRVYAEVMSTERRTHHRRQRTFGLSGAASANIGQSADFEHSLPPIYPFEFVEFVEELLSSFNDQGIERLTIMLDEANKLALPAQQQLLTEYRDLLAGRRLNFAFVAGFRPPELREPRVPMAFEIVQQVNGLALGPSLELLDRVARVLELDMPAAASTELVEQVAGKPSALIAIMQRLSVEVGDTRRVSTAAVGESCLDYLQHLSDSYSLIVPEAPIDGGDPLPGM